MIFEEFPRLNHIRYDRSGGMELHLRADILWAHNERRKTDGNAEPIGGVAFCATNVEDWVKRPIAAHNADVPNLCATSPNVLGQVAGW